MRAVDADELRKHAFTINQGNGVELEPLEVVPLAVIDNAQTVEPEKVLVANVTFDKDQLEQIIRDRVIEPIKNGELVLQTDKRPEGEWGKWIVAEIQCPNCFKYFEVDDYSSEKLNKCPNCGEYMKGGAE